MKTNIFVTVLALILALPATAQFREVSHGYEVALSDLRLPRFEGGTIAYKPCSDCDYQTSRVSTDARFLINGKEMRLSDFRKRTALLGDRENHTVVVSRHIESNRITKVWMVIRDAE